MILYVADKEKPSKFMSSKDTHLIPSDFAFRTLVFDDAGHWANMFVLPVCCQLAISTGSPMFVIFSNMTNTS